MKFSLKQETIAQINNIFRKYSQVETAIIYGSRAKGTSKNGSDIDLTLKGRGLNLSIVNKLGLDIDDLFLPYTFDISVFKNIDNPDLIDHIKRVGKIFYQK